MWTVIYLWRGARYRFLADFVDRAEAERVADDMTRNGWWAHVERV